MAAVVAADAPPAAAQDFRFSLAQDMRDFSGPDHDTSDYFRGVCEAMDALGPGVFLLGPGDIDHPPEPPGSPGDVYWTIEKYMGTGFPWYPGVGNHEAETASDMAWLRAWNAGGNSLPYVVNVGPGGPGPSGSQETTYSFDYGDAHFVQLNQYYDGSSDSGAGGDVVDALYDWLEDDLQATTQPLIFVMGHEPAWPQPDVDSGRIRHLGDSLDQHPSNRDRFWSLLRQHPVVAFIVGHTHNFSAVNIDGVWQIDAGHARGVGDTGSPSTFALVDVVGGAVTFHTYRGSGAGGSYSLAYSDLVACDGCRPVLGCRNLPNTDPCDDGNACTEDDVCFGGSCSGTQIPGCAALLPSMSPWGTVFTGLFVLAAGAALLSERRRRSP